MSSCFGCGGLQPEVKLLNDCYPPSKQLLAAGPEFKPLSSDLSKLTYRCTNQSSKLAKVGEELEKRVAKEAGRSTGGYAKSRASLLISLSILRALISECRRDLALFSRSIVRIVNHALEVKLYQKGELDLEVIGRAASCFIAYVTYAEGASIGVDDAVTNTYIQVLRKFAMLSTNRSEATTANGGTTTNEKTVDNEMRNKTRLIGLASLNGVSSSDALFASSADTKRQIDLIIPALLYNLFDGSIDVLKEESAKIDIDTSPSPFFTEFSARRPVNDRRAPSIYAHIPGEKGPEDSDVTSAALRSLHALIRQSNVNTATQALHAVFAFFDRVGWNDVERSCWLAERITSSIPLQYRFVVPTRLVEVLFDLEDKQVTKKQMTLLVMATAILDSHISLVGLGVTDLLNNLVALIIRRIHFDDKDSLLPPLVQSISSLGTHIYYADQINDIIEEIAQRMAEVDVSDKDRPEILRVLIYAMTGVLNTTMTADVAEARMTAHQETLNGSNGDKGKKPALHTPNDFARSSGRRNPVMVEVWQETLPLLCESTFAVRSAYARALLLFLTNEIPREKKGVKTDRSVHRFCNAVHASVYTLAMSSCLGSANSASSPAIPTDSPVAIDNGPKAFIEQPGSGSAHTSKTHPAETDARTDGKPEKGVSFNITQPTPSTTPGENGSGANTPTRKRRGSRRVSLPLTKLDSNVAISSFENVATPFDFAMMICILEELHIAVPSVGLLTGVPMLLALDRDAALELVRRPGDGRSGSFVLERKRSLREVCAIMWKKLGDKWGITEITAYANKIINSLPEPFEVPNPTPAPPGILPPPEEPTQFYPHTTEGESSNATLPILDPDVLVPRLAAAPNVVNATGLETPELLERLSGKWTVDSAVKNAVETYSSAPKSDHDPHSDVANVLMSMSNPSFQSFGRPQSRAVDVSDLREALGGKTDRAPSAAPSIVSTTAGQSHRSPDDASGRKRLGNTDVQEVLKDIFKNSKGKKSKAKPEVTEMDLGRGDANLNGVPASSGGIVTSGAAGINGASHAREVNNTNGADTKPTQSHNLNLNLGAPIPAPS